jgi:tetratricopeptide (TPR) repeat protein
MAMSADGAGASAFGRQPGPVSRTIRVFVSSTFADMQEERDELVKQVFPSLRELCESRGVVWEEVDLRWGITDKQRDEGMVLPICLEEIRECRPYFIGLLGERYGFVPTALDAALVEREPWLLEHRGKSVTELEIIHGVLADPSMADHALFYFRDTAYTSGRAAFAEAPGTQEIKEFGESEAWARARQRSEKLAALKQRIRESGLPVRENYANPRELGQLALRDLTAVVDSLFPAGSEPTPLERERRLHETFARSRADVYIAPRRPFDLLDEHVAGDGAPIAVLGEAGVGKSALLANWALQRAARAQQDGRPIVGDDGEMMLMHFVAASPASADWVKMAQRVIAELDDRFGMGLPAPTDTAGVRERLSVALQLVPASARVVLIIDGLNQLEDRDGAPDLAWVPTSVPPNVRLIVSTLPGRPQDEWARRGWPTLEVQPLNHGERVALINDYLKQYAKKLPSEFVDEIAAAPQAANPLFLRLMLEELRLYGDHDTLKRRLDELIEADDIPALYGLILSRWEHDYQRDRPALVPESMILLWAARRGLSEAELRDLLGGGGGPLPHAFWSPLYLAAKHTLVNHDGILSFAHDYARMAVEDRYLKSKLTPAAAHIHLAQYVLRTYNTALPEGFEQLVRGGRTTAARETLRRHRLLDELAWQVAQSGEWDQLAKLLGGDVFFDFAWLRNRFEVCSYWRDIERHRPGAALRTYARVIASPEQDTQLSWHVAQLLDHLGYQQESAEIFRGLNTAEAGEAESADSRAGALVNQAVSELKTGAHEEALTGLDAAIAQARSLGADRVVATGLRNKGAVLFSAHQHRQALGVLDEAEAIYRRLDDPVGVAACLEVKAPILAITGHPDTASALFEEQEGIYRQTDDLDALARALSNHANELSRQGDPAAAEARLSEALAVIHRLDDDRRVARVYEVRARVRFGRDWPGCLSDLDECERLARETGQHTTEATAIYMRGLVNFAFGQWDSAEVLATRAASIRQGLNDATGAAQCSELAGRAIKQRIIAFQQKQT